jgi:hypothetical protein
VSLPRCHEQREHVRHYENFTAAPRSDVQSQAGVERCCDLCAATIHPGADFQGGILTPYEAAALLDVDDPALVPTWTQLPDGTVQLDICLGCWSLIDDP